MDRGDRESFLRDLAEKYQEINNIFDDYGLEAPTIDCDIEDCTLPDDHDIMVLRNSLREGAILLEDYMN